ncbi:MAG TPA: AgmX/PglI C-terminal domain-containing protein, partial [Kofleriaceae bacterium]|nr:AgmX/PglI C-terminal domain-containing protein [Kofleriaceae bacterium]
CGIYGSGGYRTIGSGPGTGEGYGPGHAGGWGHGRHPQTPPVVIGQPSNGGGLDKSIIRRYVKRNEEKIAYCYGKELLAHPNLEGEVLVQFMIAPDGTVQASNGRGFDATVASCVASVVHGITFPRPTDNGPVQVNYPFTFHHRGG